MKKNIYCLIILVAAVLFIAPTKAYAVDNPCATYGIQECSNHTYDNGQKCTVKSITKSGYSSASPCCTTQDGYCESGTVDSDTQNNYDPSGDVVCGNDLTFNKSIANVTHYMVLLFQIVGPVMLIILGGIDLIKAVTAGKDDDIKKAQSVFIKRLVTAIIMFLVITIVRILISILSTDNIMDCFKCFVNGASSCK